MPMLERKKVLIFDLGGVLIDLYIEHSFAALVQMGADPSMLTERNCLINTRMMQYDRGEISTKEMFSYIASQLPGTTRQQLGRALEPRLREVWNMMLGGFDSRKFGRIKELRAKGFRVVMLSNTNDAHWGVIEKMFAEAMGEPLQNFFDAFYLSFRMHRRKPEREMFLELLAAEGADAADCLFFDDSAENCAAAQELGIDSVLLQRNAAWDDNFLEY